MKKILFKLSFIAWVLIFTSIYLTWSLNRLFSPPQVSSYSRLAIDVCALAVVFITSFWNANKHHETYAIWSQYLKMVLMVVVSIILFAAIYKDIGIVAPGGEISNNPWDAIYFSLVTWTTLGYGDFRPLPDGRLFASLEAMLGYLYMALLIGTVFFHMQRIHDSNKSTKKSMKVNEG